MDLTRETSKDGVLLQRLDLSPLDPALTGGDEQFAGLIEASNSQVAGLLGRFVTLADQRQRLADFQNWLDADAASVEGNQSALRVESWNLLVAVRKFLAERDAVLRRLEAAADKRTALFSERHQAIRNRLCKVLDVERREMLAASPTGGNRHFADLIDTNEEVEDARLAYALSKANLDAVVEARRKASEQMWSVKARQREVFPLIAA